MQKYSVGREFLENPLGDSQCLDLGDSGKESEQLPYYRIFTRMCLQDVAYGEYFDLDREFFSPFQHRLVFLERGTIDRHLMDYGMANRRLEVDFR